MEPYTSNMAAFKFRGREFRFALSHGLFSSAGVDRGTALLLKIVSRLWDEDQAAGRPPPERILDAGCGAGIIAVSAAGALQQMSAGPTGGAGDAVGPETQAGAGGPGLYVRAQDRDELARLFTAYNARINGIGPECLSAHTEALLSGPPNSRWDLILSNIPAKAGGPVLEDFIRRSAALLNPGGKAALVAVNTLADFFRSRIGRAGGEFIREERGPEHTVFVYGAGPETRAGTGLDTGAEGGSKAGAGLDAGAAGGSKAGPEAGEPAGGLLPIRPCYLRKKVSCELEGLPLRMDTVHGAPGFDRPGGAVEAAAKLAIRLGRDRILSAAAAALVHEPEQGWFPAWLLAFLERDGGEHRPRRDPVIRNMTVSGRNILALEAARHNIECLAPLAEEAAAKEAAGPELSVVPAVELSPGGLAGLPEGGFGFIAAFPETVPRTDRREALWGGLTAFLAPGGLALVSLSSSEAERLDRKKPPGFRRLGNLKRSGFRALAYEKTPNTP